MEKIDDFVIKLLHSHRSIRKYQRREIDAELFESIIKAGQSASSSSHVQSVSLIRVTEPLLRTQFVEISGGQPYVATCSEFLVFCADLNRNRERIQRIEARDVDYSTMEQFITATVDVALFAQNVVIAAESAALGCCYIGGIRNDPEKVSELLKLPDLVYPVFGLCIGYPDQHPECKPRLPLEVQLNDNAYCLDEQAHAIIDSYDDHVRSYYERRTGGKLTTSWSEQMSKQESSQKREFMKKYIQKQGFAKK